MTPKLMREYADFYSERPCVDEALAVPTLTQVSRGECVGLTTVFVQVADELDRLRRALTRIAVTEYGEDGARRHPPSHELKSWAREALGKNGS